MPSSRTNLACALALTSALALTGCSTTASTQATSSPSSSSTNSTTTTAEPSNTEPSTPSDATQTPKPPVLPQAAKENTEEGAFAFAYYFAETLTYVMNTLDVDALAQISTAECGACTTITGELARYKEQGSHYEGFTIDVKTVEVIKFEADEKLITIDFEAPVYKFVSSSGETTTNPAEAQLMGVSVEWHDGWIVTRFGAIDR